MIGIVVGIEVGREGREGRWGRELR